MLKIYKRYLICNFIPPFLVSILFFVTFLLTFQLFRVTRIFVSKGVDFSSAFELILHIGVSFLPMAIPFSMLFAIIYTMNKLSEDSEIVAMRSFGLDKFQLFIPLFITSIVVAFMTYSLSKEIVPYSKRVFKNKVIQLTSKEMIADITLEHFFTQIPNITLFAEKVENKGAYLENVFIHMKSSNKTQKKEQVISAKSGGLVRKMSSDWEFPKLRLTLKEGNILTTDFDKNTFEKIVFQEYDFPIIFQDIGSDYVNKDSMQTSRELYSVIKKYRGQKKSPPIRTEIEYYSRINISLQCLFFALLGFSLGIKRGRGKNRNTSGIGLIVLISYYTVLFTGISMAKKGVVDAQLAVFFPTVALFLVGLYYFFRLDWNS